MLFHELREHVVLRAKSLLQPHDAAARLKVRLLSGRTVRALQDDRTVLKKLLEPTIEDGGLDLGFVAEGRDRNLRSRAAE